MSFDHMLVNADPEDAAEAALVIARALVNDTSASEAARATSAKILELSTEELTQRLRRAKEREASANDDAGAERSSRTEPSST